MFVRIFICGFKMQREGNCPLNAHAFAKLKLLTIYFSVFGNAIFPWICGVDDCSGKAIAHSMPALLRS